MSHSLTGTDIYAAIPVHKQQAMPLMPGDLVDVRVLFQDHSALSAQLPGGRMHALHSQLEPPERAPQWPSLMFRGLFVGESVLRITEQLPEWSVFGPRGQAIEDLLDQYLFLDDIGRASYHRIEQIGRTEFRRFAEEQGDDFLAAIADGSVYGGKYWMACRALSRLAQSQCASGPLALAAAIVLRGGLREEAYERLVHPYRAAAIPFLERVD